MLSDADIKAIKGHLEHSCDCPAHTYVAPLIVELTEARAEALIAYGCEDDRVAVGECRQIRQQPLAKG